MMKPRFILAIAMILTLTLCGCTREVTRDDLPELMSDFSAPQAVDNQADHYAVLNGEHYIDLNRLSPDGTLDKIADNVPPGNPYMADFKYLAADGEYLYCNAKNMQTSEENEYHMRSGIYRIDVTNNTIIPLLEWENDEYTYSNPWLYLRDGYIYFLLDLQLCRIKTDGTEFEKLSDYNDSYRCTNFFIDDNGYCYYIQNLTLYRASDTSLADSEELISDVGKVTLYDGYLYYSDSILSEDSSCLYRVPLDFSSDVQLLADDMSFNSYYICNNAIYYCKNDPIIVKENPDGTKTRNSNQGQINRIDPATGEITAVTTKSDLAVSEIYNANDKAVIVSGHTNADLIAENGISKYFILPVGTNQYFLVDDKTLLLQGT